MSTKNNGKANGFSVSSLFEGGDGNWGEATSMGWQQILFKGGSIVRVEINGQSFFPSESSQTAPAVPGTAFGLHHVSRMYQVMRKHDSTIDDAALDSMRDTLRHALSAAPQPDHSPDAGKVVQGEPVGFLSHVTLKTLADGKPVKLYPVASDWVCKPVYANPSESCEEIHRLGQQLYDAARFLGCAQAGGNLDAAEHWSAKAEAILARLRASQQEGEDNDK